MEVIREAAQDTARLADAMAVRIFLKSLEILGGPRKLFEYRNLTWLPTLMEAAYVVTLVREHGKTMQEAARELGLSSQTVRNILNADAGEVRKRIEEQGEELARETHTHVAGGLAKLAHEQIRKGDARIGFLEALE